MTTGSFQMSDLIQHSAWVERLARSLVRDPEVAEEVVQETWLRTIRNPPRPSSSARSKRAFLGTVVRNLIRQNAREARHRRGREEAYAAEEALPSTADMVAAVDGHRAVVEEVLALPAAQRDTLLLRYFQDLSSAEIARRTDTSHATVRSRLKRGLDELRSRLDEKAGGDARSQLMAIVLAAPAATSKAVVPSATAPLSFPAILMSKSHVVLVACAAVVVCGIAGVHQFRSGGDVADPGALRADTAARDGHGGGQDIAQVDEADDGSDLARPIESIAPESGRRSLEREDAQEVRTSQAKVPEFVGRVVDLEGRPLTEVTVWLGRSIAVEDDDVERVERFGPTAIDEPDADDSDPVVLTDERGRFRFDAPPTGRRTVWAKRRDSRYGWAQVDGAQMTEPIEIAIEVLPREKRIAGVVQNAIGEPYPDARLTYSVVDAGGSAQSSGVVLDGQGRFEIEVLLDSAYDLVADDPNADPARPMRAHANDVTPGTIDLVLRLGEASILNVQIRNGAGDPIEDVGITPMIGDEHTSVSIGSYPGPHAGGLVELPLPGRSFFLQIAARGYHDERVGPLDPESITGVVDVELRRAPRVAGVVVSNGLPVAGARVRLYRPSAPGMHVQIDGYTVHFRPDGASATTGADGAFELFHRHGGTYRVIATHDDYASADSGALELEPDEDRTDLSLELALGGTLIVHAPEGTAEGATVVAHRGIGSARSAKVDDEGIARFTHIAPGRWCVRVEDSTLRGMRGSTQMRSDAPADALELPWNCKVRAGRTETVRL